MPYCSTLTMFDVFPLVRALYTFIESDFEMLLLENRVVFFDAAIWAMILLGASIYYCLQYKDLET